MALFHPVAWLFEHGRSESLRVTLYRTSTLFTGAICLLLMAPANAALGLTPGLNAVIAAVGVLCLGLHWLARRGRVWPAAFCLLIVGLLDAGWLLTAGSLGTAVMWMYSATALLTVLFRGRARLVALAAFVANGLALYWIDVLRPDLVAPYASAHDRVADLVTGFPLSVLTCALLVWSILEAYDRERRQLKESNRVLERTLAELKTLRGLLPVCGWCHRIRDEKGSWSDLSTYVTERTEAKVTHGICPDCADRHFPQA